jgi:TP901 family phage tail tape measure protein
MKAMDRSLQSFGNHFQSIHASNQRLFRKMTPALSEAGKQFMSFASTAAIAGGIIGGITFSAQSVIEYEKALASFRTIVGGTDAEFSKYQNKINEVARDTKKSSVETAAAFEKIAGLNAEFAETADGIGSVSKAVITLSKASGDELGPSAESLVGIMNQFSFKANQADRAINVLAAGAGVGAASIVQTAESFTTFGSVASGANVTLEQSVGLIQTLGKFSLFGSEAGNQLKGTILRLQQAGVGYKSGQFKINDALAETKKKYDTLKTAKEKDAYLTKTFGAINIGVGRILVNNIDTYNKFTKGVTGTSEAQKQAAIRSNTLLNKISEFKAAWVNMITGSTGAGKALNFVKRAVQFLTDNLDYIVEVGLKVLMFFAGWKLTLMASSAAIKIVEGAIWLAEAAQVAWNAVMMANPIGLVTMAVFALGAAIVWIASKFEGWGDQWDIIITGMGYVIDGFTYSVKSSWLSMENSFASAIDGMKLIWLDFQKSLGLVSAQDFTSQVANIGKQKAARDQEIRDMNMLSNLSFQNASLYTDNVLKKKSSSGTDPNAVAQRQQEIASLKESYSQKLGMKLVEASAERNGIGSDKLKELMNPKAAQADAIVQKMESTNNAKVELEINTNGADVKANSSNKYVSVVPKVGSTMKK